MELIPKLTKSRSRQIATPGIPVPSPQAIAEAAYYLAERRGFTPGHELEDWLEAEHQLNPRPEPVAEAR